MIATAVGDVERALAQLWSDASRADTHTSLFTLVAFCAHPDELPRARAALVPVMAAHPCRTVTVTCYDDGSPSISARVGLHVDTARGAEPVGEDIDLDVRGGAREWVPATLARLRRADVPLYMWWVGDLPDDDRLFDHLLEVADVAVVHTADMDLRDLEALASLLVMSRGGYVIADLTWARLRAWQEFTARFFDDDIARPHLRAIREVIIAHAPREREAEAASTQAALFAGWLAAALGWNVSGATWVSEGATHTATVRDAAGEPIALRFVTDACAGVRSGAILRVALSSPEAAFEVARAPDDALVLCWKVNAPGLVVPSQCVRIGVPEEPKMLARVLDRPRRDSLFDRALAAAASLVAPVSQRSRWSPA